MPVTARSRSGERRRSEATAEELADGGDGGAAGSRRASLGASNIEGSARPKPAGQVRRAPKGKGVARARNNGSTKVTKKKFKSRKDVKGREMGFLSKAGQLSLGWVTEDEFEAEVAVEDEVEKDEDDSLQEGGKKREGRRARKRRQGAQGEVNELLMDKVDALDTVLIKDVDNVDGELPLDLSSCDDEPAPRPRVRVAAGRGRVAKRKRVVESDDESDGDAANAGADADADADLETEMEEQFLVETPSPPARLAVTDPDLPASITRKAPGVLTVDAPVLSEAFARSVPPVVAPALSQAFVCPETICGRVFSRKMDLAAHRLLHEPSGDAKHVFVCNDCGNSSMSETTLRHAKSCPVLLLETAGYVQPEGANQVNGGRKPAGVLVQEAMPSVFQDADVSLWTDDFARAAESGAAGIVPGDGAW